MKNKFGYASPFWWTEQSRRSMGLTARDHFAGLAMQAIITGLRANRPWCDLARDAFEIADAMLAERDKP